MVWATVGEEARALDGRRRRLRLYLFGLVLRKAALKSCHSEIRRPRSPREAVSVHMDFYSGGDPVAASVKSAL